MPKSKTHRNINFLILTPLIVVLLQLYIELPVIAVGVAFFVYATLWFNPDADVSNQIKLFSIKGLLTLPLRFFYAPFFRHRGFSHTIIGTFTRLLALAIFLFVVTFIFLLIQRFAVSNLLTAEDLRQIGLHTLWISQTRGLDIVEFASSQKTYFISAFLGVFVADIIHIVTDKLAA